MLSVSYAGKNAYSAGKTSGVLRGGAFGANRGYVMAQCAPPPIPLRDGVTVKKFQCWLPSIEMRWELTCYNFCTALPHTKRHAKAFVHRNPRKKWYFSTKEKWRRDISLYHNQFFLSNPGSKHYYHFHNTLFHW